MLPRSIIIAYNTNSFTIIHPRPEAIADAEEIADHKDQFENMGKLKIETTIKVKGKGFACK
jgi:predicted oxidoreductase